MPSASTPATLTDLNTPAKIHDYVTRLASTLRYTHGARGPAHRRGGAANDAADIRRDLHHLRTDADVDRYVQHILHTYGVDPQSSVPPMTSPVASRRNTSIGGGRRRAPSSSSRRVRRPRRTRSVWYTHHIR